VRREHGGAKRDTMRGTNGGRSTGNGSTGGFTVAELTPEEVAHVAQLAYLRFTPDELERLRGQLTGILAYISQLDEVDTATISPTAQVIPLTNVLRPDETQPPLPTAVFLANVPRSEDGFIEVDAVLEDA